MPALGPGPVVRAVARLITWSTWKVRLSLLHFWHLYHVHRRESTESKQGLPDSHRQTPGISEDMESIGEYYWCGECRGCRECRRWGVVWTSVGCHKTNKKRSKASWSVYEVAGAKIQRDLTSRKESMRFVYTNPSPKLDLHGHILTCGVIDIRELSTKRI